VGEVEQTIASIWQELLGLERVGRHDHFFELGGHSLLAVRLTARIQEAFDIDISLRSVFEKPALFSYSDLVLQACLDSYKADDISSLEIDLHGLSEAELRDILEKGEA
jgi:acyl carrier protein